METIDNLPLVSCLCVTEARPEKLRRAIACFVAQTYPHKELLVLFPEDDYATRRVLAAYEGQTNVKHYAMRTSERMTLGEKRNLSIRQCHGDYFCLWDDDDWYHPDRVQLQTLAAMKHGKAACLLTHLLLFDVQTGYAYLSQTRLWEGSLLCRTDVVSDSLRYEVASIVEDTAFINGLVAERLVYPLASANLYVYERHGSNTSGKKIATMMFRMAQRLSGPNAEILGKVLSSTLSNEEAIELMRSRQLLEELDYFHGIVPTLPSEGVAKFREFLERNDE